MDNQALQQRLATRADLLTLWDVWENEPDISQSLLDEVNIGTPHIAGYSVEAKRNASDMNYQSFLQYFSLANVDAAASTGAERERVRVPGLHSDGSAGQEERAFAQCLCAAFDVAAIDAQLRRSGSGAAVFDGIRRQIAARREFSHYTLEAALSPANAERLAGLGFEVHLL